MDKRANIAQVFISLFLLLSLIQLLIFSDVEAPEPPSLYTKIERTATTDNFCSKESCTKTYYTGSVNMLNETGGFEPYEDVTSFVFNPSTFSLNLSWWGNKSIVLYLTANVSGTEYILDKSNSLIKSNLNLTNLINKNKGGYYYTHNFSLNLTALGVEYVGYKIKTSNVKSCEFENNALICDEQKIDLSQAVNEQKIDINYNNTNLFFRGKDLSFIDPTTVYNFSNQTRVQAFSAVTTEAGTISSCLPNGTTHVNTTEINQTGDSNLDLNDNLRLIWMGGSNSGKRGYLLFEFNVEQPPSSILSLNFSLEHLENLGGNSGAKTNFLEYNDTGATWFPFGSQIGGSGNVIRDINITSSARISDLINASSIVNFAICTYNPAGGTNVDARTDWARLEVSYTPNTAPTVSLPSSFNNSIITSPILNISYNASDVEDNLNNCSLFLTTPSGSVPPLINITNTTPVLESINQTFNFTALSIGAYRYLIGCYENSTTYLQGNSSLQNFTINNTIPSELLSIYPNNNTPIERVSPLSFTYEINDTDGGEFGTINNCTIYLTGNNSLTYISNSSDTTISEEINQTFNITNLQKGNYHWFTGCVDNGATFRYINSSIRNFTINNSIPIAPLLNGFTNASSQSATSITLNFSSTDLNQEDIIRISIWGDTQTIPTTFLNTVLINGSGNSTSYLWGGLTQGASYSFRFVVGDGYNNNSNSSIYTFTVSSADTGGGAGGGGGGAPSEQSVLATTIEGEKKALSEGKPGPVATAILIALLVSLLLFFYPEKKERKKNE